MAVFMLRWLSNHVSRFRTLHAVDTFTWSILGSDMLISSNCAWVPITVNSVLSSFTCSLSLSAVIQVLMSRTQSCNAVTASNSLALEPGLNGIYNWLSSAYTWTSGRCRFTTSNCLLAQIVKSSGPRHDPCSTPCGRENSPEKLLLSNTRCDLPAR